MKRLVRHPKFWVALVVASFALNSLVAIVTLHQTVLQPPNGLFLFGSHHHRLSNSNFFTNVAKTQESGTPESILWRRMLQEQSDCHRVQDSFHSSNRTQGTALDKSALLPAFGFPKRVHQYISSYVKGEKGQQLRASVNHEAYSCFLPPEASCTTTKYSVVVYSRGGDLRQLFLHLLSFYAYPTVQDVTLILPSDFRLDVSKYGKRLLEWNQRGILQLVQEATLWSSMSSMPEPKSAAMVWINGDTIRKDWNGTMLKTTLDYWREHPRSLVTAADTIDAPSSCPNRLHGNIVHSNLLCFLTHPVVEPLRRHVESLEWDAVERAIAILWNHLGNGHLWLSSSTTSRRIQQSPTRGGKSQTILDYFGCACTLQRMAITTPLENRTCVPLSNIDAASL